MVSAGWLLLAFRLRTELGHDAPWYTCLLAEAFIIGLLAGPVFRWFAGRNIWAESVRWMALAGAGLLLTLPYLRSERVGAGDSQDYAQNLADYIVQARHGIFPVMVGQSEFAFNGAFNPLRTAPYFQYFGGCLDGLTLGALGPYALQNLAIILSLCAAGFLCYFCLRRMANRRPWLCLLLSLLYISSPGVLALVYDGDMIPSWLTLPYLPIYVYLLARIAEKGANGPRLAAMATVMAMIWCIHAPIAMWLSFIAFPVIFARLVGATNVPILRRLTFAMGALLLFAVLAAYEFVSVAELKLPTLPQQLSFFRTDDLLAILRIGWAGVLRPVGGDGPSLLYNLQLSAPLWGCLILGFLVWRRRTWGLSVLLVASAILLILLAPFSAIAGRFWASTPAWVDQITDKWPMQRFYPILSAIAPFAGLLALETLPNRRWFRRSTLVILALGCCWSGYEARKFLHRGFQVALSGEQSRLRIRAENTVFSTYSNDMLGDVPCYFSHGPTNPSMQLRLLDPTSNTVSQSNLEAILRGAVGPDRIQTRQFVAIDQGAELKPPLTLQAGHTYLLKFNFDRVPPPGTLVVSSKNFFGEYPLPTLDRPTAFGAVPGANSNIALYIDDTEDEAVSIRFVGVPGTAPLAPLPSVDVVHYHATYLPFRIIDLVPLRVSVNAQSEGWLETPRIYIAGYRATINGEPVQTKRSPDGRVMAHVPAGSSLMELTYPGTFLLRSAFWMSFISWLLVPLCWLAWSLIRTISREHSQSEPEILVAEPGLQLLRRGGIAMLGTISSPPCIDADGKDFSSLPPHE